MSLILDALKRARQLGHGKPASREAENLMRSFGTGQRAKRRQTRKVILIVLPAIVLATGIAFAGNYWLKQRARGAMGVVADREPVTVPSAAATDPVPSEPVAPPPAESTAAATPPAATPVTPPATPSATSQPDARAASRTTTPSAEPAGAAPANRPALTTPGTTTSAATTVAPAPPPLAPTLPPAAAPSSPPPITAPAPASPATISVTSAGDPRKLLAFYLETQDYKNALVECNKAKAANPTDPSVRLHCGAAHLGLREFAEAIREFDVVTKLNVGNDRKTMAFNNLGAVYLEQREYRYAQAAFDKAIEFDANNSKAHLNSGLVAIQLGTLEKAKTSLARAIQLDPANPQASYNLADIYDRQGETGRAIEYYQRFRDTAAGLPAYREHVVYADTRIEELRQRLPNR